MTKVERHDDIQDNINFLNSIYASLKLDQFDFKLNVLGFSQGGPLLLGGSSTISLN